MAERWVRLFYRNGKSKAFREGPELDRARARKVPLIIYEAEALWHRCQVCGAEGVWTAEWIAWARYNERHQARGEGDDIYCSELCCRAENPDRRPPDYMRIDSEPMPIEMRRAIYSARNEAVELVRDAKSYRRCPLPEWPGNGFCKWCAGPMDKIKEPRRVYWHEACARQFMLHTDLWTQIRFLRERDGRQCAMPGCEREGGEVDHRVPLWKVRHLAAMIRRAFYGPINLWLLCHECHAAKTKAEAAERAALAKESGQLAGP